MKKKNKFGDDTLSIHAGQKPDVEFGARAQPIYWTSTFVFDDTDSAASLFNMERAGHVYSRISNPTVSSLEERIASLESGVGSIVTSSGQSSLHLAITTLMNAGSHIVASSSLYGGSHNLLKYTLPRFGIGTTFIDSNKPGDFKKAIKKNTRLIFTETVANPQLKVADIPSLAEIANESNIPLLVDSTLTSSYLINPVKYGASLVMHSLTKFMSGHGTAMGGVIIGYEIGKILKKETIFCERINGKFVLRRGFRIKKNSKVLIIEDVITTGKSSLECVKLIKKEKAKLIGFAAIIDRSTKKTLRIKSKIISEIKINVPTYKKNKLPIELASKSITIPGSRFIK